ncbi:hypothetical protein CF67_04152 [Candidatus Photodesmus blepharus]|uniref:CheW-like domain-containing protein n=2 Tax=Candidatus Photodesmus blepharonis TaxID=1179155 RepID=A0A084CMW9_9GAMM|nr:hypothetical protein CF67_04152 [Candidatus Photodesmus blepharus]
MMNNDLLFSSKRVLEDYFSALLDGEDEYSVVEDLEEINLSTEIELQMLRKARSREGSCYLLEDRETKISYLQNVEGLLSQLESSKSNEKLGFEEFFEKEETLRIEKKDVSVVEKIQGISSQFSNWNVKRIKKIPVLYFEINAITFAVPLDELGGVYRIKKLNHLIGKPNWYLGLQINKNSKLNVVDAVQWGLSGKGNCEDYRKPYQYIVMLGKSTWGLASTDVKSTEILDIDKIYWRKNTGRQPWLSGMIKEKMCALIYVEALVVMLSAGLDIKALNNILVSTQT